jgi:predicted transcriptional regulator
MKKIILLLVLFSSIIISCEILESSNNNTQEEELAELIAHHDYILSLVASATCSSNSTCEYVAVGSKACGGPKSYLVYPSSMETSLLLEQVTIYNLKEQQYNQKWGIVSDCMFVSPPIRVDCINNKCVAIYNN